MKDFHCCATCKHFKAVKESRNMKYYCSRLGFETKTTYKFDCWSPNEHVLKLLNKNNMQKDS
ncbi:hypothetical protein GCM10007380_10700 [Gottfriedia solisilvae]|uniref:Uncharacterized protein n=1 Tax=Gottfriedia solisilvae TaxID=1516104 RepID=A0A8J3EXE2_9BACI|nr:hypothetical protein GCM10007380_10700 [Gottfriedia solisilvae]